jgi:hypothetical protein
MCASCTRRLLVLGLVALATTKPALPQTILPIFCANGGPLPPGFSLHSSSGNRRIDDAMIAEIKKIVVIFPINPGFKFIDDSSPNAFAVPDSYVPNTQGTVFLGLNLMNSEFASADYGGVAVAGICAHECGHVFQMQNGYMQSLAGPTAQLIELHADFLAGYYLGRDGSHSRDHVELFARSLFSRGDYNYNNQTHHGTPDQRVRAMHEGYSIGAQRTDVYQAGQYGANFVRGI